MTTSPYPLGHPDMMILRGQNYTMYNFSKNDEFPVLHWKFWIEIEITFPWSGCSRYLKACRRPTLWLLSSQFGRMQEHPLWGKDTKHQSSIYLIKINKTWYFLVKPPNFHYWIFFLFIFWKKLSWSFLDRLQIFIW